MPKAKKTKRGIPPAAANDPTPERMARDEFVVVDAPRMVGERVGRDRISHTRRQASRVRRMEADGWVTRAEGAALEQYERLIEAAGYGGGRSCLDMSPRSGGGPEGIVDSFAEARRALARAANAVSVDGPGQVALIFVNAVLSPYGTETLTDVIDRMLTGPRAHRREVAHRYCSYVGSALANHFRVGNRRSFLPS